jgi:hypothetical protein
VPLTARGAKAWASEDTGSVTSHKMVVTVGHPSGPFSIAGERVFCLVEALFPVREFLWTKKSTNLRVAPELTL